MKTTLRIAFLALLSITSAAFAGPKDVVVINEPNVNVVNTADVNVTNAPDVVVTNGETDPLPVRSTVLRMPVLCVVPEFVANAAQAASCFSSNTPVTPVPAGHVLAITDVIASSRAPALFGGQGIVRVVNRDLNGVEFGPGVPMMIKPGETVSLHYQTPQQVLPAGRTPFAGVAAQFGDVFPVEVHLTGYLVAEDDLGR